MVVVWLEVGRWLVPLHEVVDGEFGKRVLEHGKVIKRLKGTTHIQARGEVPVLGSHDRLGYSAVLLPVLVDVEV